MEEGAVAVPLASALVGAQLPCSACTPTVKKAAGFGIRREFSPTGLIARDFFPPLSCKVGSAELPSILCNIQGHGYPHISSGSYSFWSL